jgi:hypothetical protein
MTQISGYMLYEILSLSTHIQNMRGQIYICPQKKPQHNKSYLK